MIFVIEPENALATSPGPTAVDLDAQMINASPDPLYREGLFTFTLTEGANIINPTPAIEMAPPTTMSLASQSAVTIIPTSSDDVSTSTSKEMMITRPANPTLPTTQAIFTSTLSSTSEKGGMKNDNPTTTYNHTTLIVVFILLGLSALGVGLWYFRRSRTRKLISNGLADLEASVQEKRLSTVSRMTNRRSWIKLNEEIEQIENEKSNNSLSVSLPYSPSANHQNQSQIEKQDQSDNQAYDYNINSQMRSVGNNLNSSSYTLNKRSSTINHFPAPPSNLPQLPPLPLTPQPQSRLKENENIFESSEVQVQVPSVTQSRHEPEIGVATTTSLPASSSRTAVAIDAYPGRTLTGSGKEISKLNDGDGLDFSQSQENSPKRQSLPYVPPVQEAERTPTFISLSQMNHEKKSPDYRSPTESLYVIYKEK
ncbi:hypothetical protein I203_102493 [Kwoniella mangroviensis CBS 8507]|uniref:uncharacterized protein n=1 Tax=Kwoniella mangroviensis CBS 8507 TaxID=1296122 RepID=UPI00080CDDD3|nr:uncharacterized protein I203_06610 [Kwoniella mangroviensis CBS 8507]OCF64428.1 hypothetical protein I203_06610 [Kwoniella mangroviensis CBS 8507]